MVDDQSFSNLSRDGWNTTRLWSGLRAEGTTSKQGVSGKESREEESEEGKEEEGSRSLSLSASVSGALGNAVVIQVTLVGTRVNSDTDSQCNSRGKSEDEVKNVKDKQDQWPSEELNEVGKETIDRGENDTKDGSEDGKVNSRVAVLLTVDKGAGETEDDHEAGKVESTEANVDELQHCGMYVE